MPIPLLFATSDGTLSVVPTRLSIAGWTARDASTVEHHIAELAALGVPRPSRVPLYYCAACSLLTQAANIEVVGAETSGEIEPVLVHDGREWWLTVGSDHTDRALERISVAMSKQACAKPVAREAWRWRDLEARADALTLRSVIADGAEELVYQSGALALLRPLAQLLAGLADDGGVAAGSVLFCGTLGAIPDAAGRAVRPATELALQLADPATGRRIEHRYRTLVLPAVS